MKNSDKIKSANYKNDFNKLTKEVNKWDPVNLISGGTPDDEYDCFVGKILSLLYKGTNTEQLEDFIKKELSKHFGYGIDIKEEYQNRYNMKINNNCTKLLAWYVNCRIKD